MAVYKKMLNRLDLWSHHHSGKLAVLATIERFRRKEKSIWTGGGTAER